ncbi:hypothetical protein KY309_03600 [Candidatus Woesearchaeota archaeon]|nr:hypothetical protein [Candidatus Woesearchaeota archaeon]
MLPLYINWNRFKYAINNNFFKKWTPQMAFILGLIFSDGNIYNKTLSLKLSNKHASDRNILIRINRTMESDYPVEIGSYFFRLRISNPIILNDVKKLGMIPNKSKTVRFPNVPAKFLRHFIRGYLDGDGWITIRNKKLFREISIGFCSGSFCFMKKLVEMISLYAKISKHNLRKRKKITKKGKISTNYSVEYYSDNAMNLIKYLYDGLHDEDLYVERKFNKQLEARGVYKEYCCKTRLWRAKEKEFKSDMKIILADLLRFQKLDGQQIAEKLGVHSSTIYRWLEKTNIRLTNERGSQKWIKRVHWKGLQNR